MNSFIMGFNNMFGNGQAKAASADFTGSREISAIKSFKNSGQMFFSNSIAIVAYFYQYFFPVNLISASFNSSIVLTVFNAVVYKINKHLSYFFFISINRKRQFASFFNKTFYFLFVSFY